MPKKKAKQPVKKPPKQPPPPPPGPNVSQRFLRGHRQVMDAWQQAEWERLIAHQESAVDAVKLEWLMKGSTTSESGNQAGERVLLCKFAERLKSALFRPVHSTDGGGGAKIKEAALHKLHHQSGGMRWISGRKKEETAQMNGRPDEE